MYTAINNAKYDKNIVDICEIYCRMKVQIAKVKGVCVSNKGSTSKGVSGMLPLMPKATAVWLVDNTSLTFKQIASFCGMHELEVKGIADGDVAHGIVGIDPIQSNQLSSEDIKRCEADERLELTLIASPIQDLLHKRGKSRYVPLARRRDKPDAIMWLLKNCPDISDLQIVKLIGTTKQLIGSIRDKSHWNMKNIRPRDPVLLGLCSQTDLDRLMSNFKNDDQSNGESL